MAYKSLQAIKSLFLTKEKVDNSLLELNYKIQSIDSMAEEYLENFDDELEFEVYPNTLALAMKAMNSEELTDKYEFSQISNTMFSVRLKEMQFN